MASWGSEAMNLCLPKGALRLRGQLDDVSRFAKNTPNHVINIDVIDMSA